MSKSNVAKLPTACAKGYNVKSLKPELIQKIRSEKKAFKKGKFSGYLQIENKDAKRPGSKAYKRFRAMVVYLTKHKNVTPEQLIENTIYTSSDLRHDMAKGFIGFASTSLAA